DDEGGIERHVHGRLRRLFLGLLLLVRVAVAQSQEGGRAATGQHHECGDADNEPLLALLGRRRGAVRRVQYRSFCHCRGRSTIAADTQPPVEFATLVPRGSGGTEMPAKQGICCNHRSVKCITCAGLLAARRTLQAYRSTRPRLMREAADVPSVPATADTPETL